MNTQPDFIKLAIGMPQGAAIKELLMGLLEKARGAGGALRQSGSDFVQGAKELGKPIADLPHNFMQPAIHQGKREALDAAVQQGLKNTAAVGAGAAGGAGMGIGINSLFNQAKGLDQPKQASSPDFFSLAIKSAGKAQMLKTLIGAGKPVERALAPEIKLTAKNVAADMPGMLSNTPGKKPLLPTLSNAMSEGSQAQSAAPGMLSGLSKSPWAKRLGLGAAGAGLYGAGNHFGDQSGYDRGGQQGFGLGQQYGMNDAMQAQDNSGFISRLMDMFNPSGNRSLQSAQPTPWNPRMLQVMREQAQAMKA